MKIKHLPVINLRLFDGGAASGGDGAGAAAPGQTGAGTPGESQAGSAVAGRGKKTGDSQTVLYGKQPAAEQAAAPAEGQQASSSDAGKRTEEVTATSGSGTLEERRKAFMALVTGEGEYKDIFDEQVQRVIDRRFRETKNLEQQLGRHQPIIDMLMQRYGIADGDPAKLLEAVENDDAYWTQAAEEAGLSVEQFKRFQKIQRENAAMKEEARRRQSREAADRQLAKWDAEAEEARKVYPSFDLNVEAQNPLFVSLLRSGIPVQHAYEVIHMEEIKAASAQQAAAQTEKRVVDGIRAKGARPPENGTAAQSAFTIKDDPSKLTRKDREEIIRRVARGERISF